MITCFITYQIDANQNEAFAEYARRWGQILPRCGATMIGFFGPHEGSMTTAYGIFSFESLAAYEQYRARLKADPEAQANTTFARREKFIIKEDRMFLKCVSAPHAELVKF